jgi:hypothetical protein
MVQVLQLIFIDSSRNFTINPLISGLSYHNSQLLKSENITAPIQEFTSCYVRNINSFTVDEFQSTLSTESWVDIFEHISYLKIFYACFTRSKLNSTHRYNQWITSWIKVLCHNKRILYKSCRGSKDTNLKVWYKRYWKVLTNAIRTEKKSIMMNQSLNPRIKHKLHEKL